MKLQLPETKYWMNKFSSKNNREIPVNLQVWAHTIIEFLQVPQCLSFVLMVRRKTTPAQSSNHAAMKLKILSQMIGFFTLTSWLDIGFLQCPSIHTWNMLNMNAWYTKSFSLQYCYLCLLFTNSVLTLCVLFHSILTYIASRGKLETAELRVEDIEKHEIDEQDVTSATTTLTPPEAMFRPIEYPSLHIFVS